MKIDQLTGVRPGGPSRRATRAGGVAADREAGRDPDATGSDRVALSGDAALLAVLGQDATEQPASPERLEAIKRAIREGRFEVNPEAIADRLIETARDLVLNRDRS